MNTEQGLAQKPGRPRKYQNEKERLRAQAACMQRRRNDARGGTPGKPGRPKKYKTEEERKAVQEERENKKTLASALAAVVSERLR